MHLICVALIGALLVIVGSSGASWAQGELVGAWEAEDIAAAVGAKAETRFAAGASQGRYVLLDGHAMTRDDPISASVSLSVEAERGHYLLRVRALSHSNGTDSYWVIADEGARQQVAPPATSEWTWMETAIRFNFDGEHSIVIGAREPTRLDRIELLRATPRPTLHQVYLLDPEPDGRRPVFINPPTFRWPDLGEGPYSIELSTSEDMADPVRFENIQETFYRPLEALEPGRWYWRVRGANPKARIEGMSFELPAGVARWPIPPWEESLANVPPKHPRLWMRPEDVPRLREIANGPMTNDLASWIRAAERAVGADLPDGLVIGESPDPKRQRTLRRWASIDYSQALVSPLGNLAFVYLLTERQDFADEARRRAVLAAELDPEGNTSHSVSDFASSAIVLNLALTYDYLHDVLTEEEKGAIRSAIEARCRIGMKRYLPAREQRLFDAHGWQHVIQDLTAGALALHGELPDAARWFAWSFKMHVALYPWYGEEDGGSQEGASYYEGTNMLQSLRAVGLFEAATGVDISRGPWYQNNPYFLIYGHPPGFPRSQFADHGGSESVPSARHKLGALLQAARTGNPYAVAYAEAIEGGFPGGLANHLRLFWSPLELPRAKPLGELPKGRVFRDVGVAYLHSAIDRPEDNIMFELRSSPYGSYNHAHADQNSFNITAYGEPLILDTGYYTAYGDEHHYGWTIHTMAHNTILVDGNGQAPRNADAYGEIAEFVVGDGFAYIVGSCPNAYHEVQLDQFDRHVLWLEPDTYVIYDVLRAPEARRFDWLLHAANEMDVNEPGRTVHIRGIKAEARVSFLLPERLEFSQTDQFSVAPEAWSPRRKGKKYPNQWHLTASTTEPQKQARFLAIVQVCRAGSADALPTADVTTEGDKIVVSLSDGRRGALVVR